MPSKLSDYNSRSSDPLANKAVGERQGRSERGPEQDFAYHVRYLQRLTPPHTPLPTRGRWEQSAEQKHSDCVDTVIIIPAVIRFIARGILGRAGLTQARPRWQSDPKALFYLLFPPSIRTQ